MAGVASLWWYPDAVANRTYVSENALSPHTVGLGYDPTDAAAAQQWTAALRAQQTAMPPDASDHVRSARLAEWVVQQMHAQGHEAVTHSFSRPWCEDEEGPACALTSAYAMVRAPAV